MIGGGEGDIVLEELSKFLSEGRGELWSLIRDQLGVQPKLWKNMVKKE